LPQRVEKIAFPPEESPDAVPARQGVTPRAVAVGLGLVVTDCLWNTYVEYIAHSARINITHFPVALFAPYVLLLLVNRFAARRLRPSLALSPEELLAVIAMGLVGSAIPAYGLVSFFLGMIATPYYLASPENQWVEYFHDHLPAWLIPSNRGDAMRWLFEGLPDPSVPIPWGVWVVPLLSWTALIGAIVVASTCLAVMLRRQWAQHERLTYPILQPAVELAGAGEEPDPFRRRLFYAGAFIPFFIICWNIISYFQPGFPIIDRHRGWMSMGAYFPRVHVSLNFYTLGFSYFANVDVLFSIWFFYLFYGAQAAVYRRVGLNLSARDESSDATTSLQASGAFLALVVWGLYVARRHLRDVFLKAVRPDCPSDDGGEILSYRTCAAGLLLSLLFIPCWFHAIGLAWPVACLLTAGLFVCYVGVARVIAETGVIYFSMPIGPAGFLPFLYGGKHVFPPATQTALTLSDAIGSQGKAMFMPPLVHAARLGDHLGAGRRRLACALALSLAVGVFVTIWYSLYLGYTRGAYNFDDYPFTRYPPRVYDALVKTLKNDVTWESERYLFFPLGIAIYALVNLLRYRFSWWPLHPIGMIVPPTHAVHSIFSLFIAWGVKTALLRVGGVGLYRRCRPFFLGLIVGHLLGVVVSFLVDYIYFPGQGHHVHSW